jgi:hypothetical protein
VSSRTGSELNSGWSETYVVRDHRLNENQNSESIQCALGEHRLGKFKSKVLMRIFVPRNQTTTKLRWFGPQENHTDRATAACWQS